TKMPPARAPGASGPSGASHDFGLSAGFFSSDFFSGGFFSSAGLGGSGGLGRAIRVLARGPAAVFKSLTVPSLLSEARGGASGLIATEKMGAGCSGVAFTWLPFSAFQTFAVLSRLPEAISLPLGEKTTSVTASLSELTVRAAVPLSFSRFQVFIVLSALAETS